MRVQRRVRKLALHLQAFVVHCTFQRHHTPGKRARLREHGLWLADAPAYFAAEALMTYRSDVRVYVAALEAAASTPLAALFRHFHAMSYQLAQMRDAFATARALNRTLVRHLILPLSSKHATVCQHRDLHMILLRDHAGTIPERHHGCRCSRR